MCNLSYAIEEKGLQRGREEGAAETKARNIVKMQESGFSEEETARILDYSLAEVSAVYKQNRA